MTYREFKDEQGRYWDAWEVRPAAIERRQEDDRRRQPRAFSDRRAADIQLRLLGGMKDGWLTFQCGAERRRLAPIPEGWALLPDSTLAVLAEKALSVSRSGLSSKVTGFGVTPPTTDIVADASDPELFD
jgi:hypothetical protein